MKNQNLEQFANEFFGCLPTIFERTPFVKNIYPRESNLGAINIIENDNDYQMEMLVPGFTKEDVKIEIDDDLLIISAKVADVIEDKWNRKEFHKKSFVRSFKIPEDAKEEDIDAKVENGILHLKINKKEEETKKPKLIEIK